MDSSVKITLDNYINNVCYPSQTLSGKVVCIFNTIKNVRAIRIKFKGRAKTRWTRKHGKSSTTYWAKEYYFNEEYNLISGGEDFHIEAGRHSYPFSYILPATLPSSFEGKHGKIEYTIKATVDRPWKIDYEDKVVLNVYSPLDLNSIPGAQNPCAVSLDAEAASGCCGASDPVTFNISLPARGYAEGQDINIGCFIENMSNVNVEVVYYRLIQTIEFIAEHPWRRERTTEFPIVNCAARTIGAHAKKSWTSTLPVPRSNFPNLIPCSIINAHYRLEVEAVLPFPNSNLSTVIPITVGSVPLSGINMDIPGTPPTPDYYAPNPNSNDGFASTSGARNAIPAHIDISYPPDADRADPTAPPATSAMGR